MVLAPDDNLWLRFYDQVKWDRRESYFLRYDGEAWHPIGEGVDIPGNNFSEMLFSPDGDAWISYLIFGLWHYEAETETWEAINTSNVFAASDSVKSMTLDENGVLWVRLEDGYARYGQPLAEED